MRWLGIAFMVIFYGGFALYILASWDDDADRAMRVILPVGIIILMAAFHLGKKLDAITSMLRARQ